jgi:uncharacterized repeat protein (TIGR02543 family)
LTADRTTKYTFKNWNTKPAGGGKSYAPGAEYTDNAPLTLYAQWEDAVETDTIVLPTPVREGFTFKGWAADSTASTGATGEYTPDKDVTLFALWTAEGPQTDPPKITAEPADVKVAAGKTASFTVKATGDGELTYQWYCQKAGASTWTAMDGQTGETLSFTAAAGQNGNKYKCVVSDGKGGETESKAVTLTVIAKPKITTQPKKASVKVGKKVTFKVKASGLNLKYQWYYQKPGTKKWVKISKATKATYSFKAKKKQNGYKYRCLVKNEAGQVYTKAVKLTVK